MEYLVTANLRAEQAGALLEALETGRLAAGEVYEDEMQRALGGGGGSALDRDLLLLDAT